MEIIQGQQTSKPTFGVHYTKKTVKRLKELTPEILRWTKNEEDYKMVKSGIEHLINAGKKIDDYCVELNDDYIQGYNFLEIRTKKTTGKCKDFLYPAYNDGRQLFYESGISSFYKKCKFIDSEEFAPQTEEEINKWVKHRTSQGKWKNLKDDAECFWEDVSEKFEDAWDCFLDFFAVSIVNNGERKVWYPITAIKSFFTNKKINSMKDSANTTKIKEIHELIDKMRTKPIKIEIKTTPINTEPKSFKATKKLPK